MRHRLLNRILNILYGLPEAEAFINPVSAEECPDYYDVIDQPMHLVEVARRVKQQTYRTSAEFLSAIDLIRSNCRQYCSQKFPELVADAEVLYTAAVAAVDAMEEEFKSCDLSEESLVTVPQQLSNGRSETSEGSGRVKPQEIWTVFVPMNKSLTEQDFLVSLAIYSKACSRRRYSLEDKVCMRKANFHLTTPAAHTEEGSVESQYVSSSGSLPSLA